MSKLDYSVKPTTSEDARAAGVFKLAVVVGLTVVIIANIVVVADQVRILRNATPGTVVTGSDSFYELAIAAITLVLGWLAAFIAAACYQGKRVRLLIVASLMILSITPIPVQEIVFHCVAASRDLRLPD